MTALILALVVSALPGAGPALASGEGREILPIGDVSRGMKAVVRTVLGGDQVEELPAEILGVMENALGPGQSLILARLEGERASFTGVAAGMSGSPVYVDGRLIGALSYRIGQFMKEPIAGITPIEYMLELDQAPPATAGLRASGTETAAGWWGDSPRPGSPPVTAPPSPAGIDPLVQPIETPLVVTGVSAETLSHFQAGFEALGAKAVAGGGGSVAGFPSSTDPIEPGDAIAAQLVRGDISIAATGTVTHVDEDKVLAFGHPFLVSGPAEFPMARAEIYTTLASLAGSSKLARVLDTVGTWEQIRLPGIAGVTSRRPEMIPMTVVVDSPGGSATYEYEVATHRDWTPLLAAVTLAASLVNTPAFTDEATLSVTGRVDLEGHPDVELENLYSGFGGGSTAAIATATDMLTIFGTVFRNRFEEPRVNAIQVRASGVEQGRLSFIEGVWPSRTEAGPGDEINYQVRLRSFRGGIETRTLKYQVPEQVPRGTLRVVIGGGSYLSQVERQILSRRVAGADSLEQIISILNRLRRSDGLYAKALRRLPGAVVQSEVMPALPPSVLTTLRTNRGSGEVTMMAEATIWEESLPMDSIVIGGTVLTLKIR